MASRTLEINITGDSSSFSRAMRRVSRDADDGSKRLGAFSRSADDAGGNFLGLSTRVGGVGGSLGTLLPVIAVATPALVALGGAATAVAGSFTAAAAGAGALGTGLAASFAPVFALVQQVTSRVEAVKGAYDAVSKARDSAARTAVSSATAETAAARQVEGAERSLEGAKRSVTLAEENLTDARFRARRELLDLQLAAEGAVISEHRAATSLAEAQQELRDVLVSRALGDATALDVRGAQNAVDTARLGVREAHVERKRANEDAKRGVDTVTDAERRLVDAHRQVADAQRGVAEAQQDAAKAVESVSASTSSADTALSKLSKAERAAVKTFAQLEDLQRRVLGGASDRIILAFSRAVETLSPMLLTLRRPFNELGDAIAGAIDRGAQALSGPRWAGALRTFIDSATQLIQPFSEIFGSIANIMRDVALASLPLVRAAVRGIADALGDLDDKATKGKIRDVVRDLVGHTRSWFNLMREVGELVFQIFNGGADAGKSLVDSLTRVVHRWNAFLATREGQREMRRFFKDAAEFTADLVTVFGALAFAIIRVSDLVIRANNGLQDLEKYVQLASDAMDAWSAVVLHDLWEALKNIPGLLARLPKIVLDASKDIGKAVIKGIVSGIKGAGGSIGGAIKGAVKGAVPDFLGIGEGIGRRISPSMGAPGLGGGALMGADPDLAPFAAIGSRMGLRVTSGLRVGAITSAGNQSYHATGDAIDMSGPAGSMRRFGQTMARTFGPRLRELIYTPLGFSIKDGRRVPPYAASDHYDHVHVAYTGPFGDGIGRVARTGDGPGANVATAFRRAISAKRANTKEQLALWEAGIVETGLRNLPYGDADSLGALQERESIYGREHALSPFKSAMRFLQDAIARRPWRGSAGSLAQAVQRSAFPARYDAAETRARRFLVTGGAPSAGGGAGGAASPFRPMSGTAPNVSGGVAFGAGGGGAPSGARRIAAPRLGGYEDILAGLDVREARAESTKDTADDLKVIAFRGMALQNRLKRINRALRNPGLSSRLRRQLLQEKAQIIRDLTDLGERAHDIQFPESETAAATEVPEPPTRADYLNAAVAEASLTPGLTDDRSALEALLGFRGEELTAARESGDPRRITEAIEAYSSVKGSLDSLTEAMTAANRLAEQRESLDRELRDNQLKILALAQQGDVIVASVIAAVNGGIGGKVGLGYQTHGFAGAGVRY